MNARAQDAALAFADNPEARRFEVAPPRLKITSAAQRTTHINRYGFEMECDYEYYPAEPRTHDEPPIAAMVVLLTVKVAGVNITPLLECSHDLVDMIEDAICEQVESA